jgi:hypothetical protein
VVTIQRLALKRLVSVFCAPNLGKVNKEQLVLVVLEAWQNRLFALLGFPLFVSLDEMDTLLNITVRLIKHSNI